MMTVTQEIVCERGPWFFFLLLLLPLLCILCLPCCVNTKREIVRKLPQDDHRVSRMPPRPTVPAIVPLKGGDEEVEQVDIGPIAEIKRPEGKKRFKWSIR